MKKENRVSQAFNSRGTRTASRNACCLADAHLILLLLRTVLRLLLVLLLVPGAADRVVHSLHCEPFSLPEPGVPLSEDAASIRKSCRSRLWTREADAGVIGGEGAFANRDLARPSR